jgi:tetratricopeptide (TPR) repeat protein
MLRVAAAVAAAISVAYWLQRRRSRRRSQLVEGGMNLLASGDAEAAVEAFDAALESDRSLRTQLWQRGLALYFAGYYRAAAAQFERDLEANPNDVEEILFHALSLTAATNGAIPTLLACGADPRGATMEALRQLFAGESSAAAVLETARQCKTHAKLHVGDYAESAVLTADHTPAEPSSESLSVAHYYIGAWHEARGEHADALRHLAAAAAAPSADYMGRIAQMHYARAAKTAARAVPTARLGGYACPRVIVGGWQLSSGHSSHPEGKDLAALRVRCQRDLAAHGARSARTRSASDGAAPPRGTWDVARGTWHVTRH